MLICAYFHLLVLKMQLVSWIQTRIAGVEGENVDRYTTTTVQLVTESNYFELMRSTTLQGEGERKVMLCPVS